MVVVPFQCPTKPSYCLVYILLLLFSSLTAFVIGFIKSRPLRARGLKRATFSYLTQFSMNFSNFFPPFNRVFNYNVITFKHKKISPYVVFLPYFLYNHNKNAVTFSKPCNSAFCTISCFSLSSTLICIVSDFLIMLKVYYSVDTLSIANIQFLRRENKNYKIIFN